MTTLSKGEPILCFTGTAAALDSHAKDGALQHDKEGNEQCVIRPPEYDNPTNPAPQIKYRGNTNHKSLGFACPLLSMSLKTKETQKVNKINEKMLFRNEVVTISWYYPSWKTIIKTVY